MSDEPDLRSEVLKGLVAVATVAAAAAAERLVSGPDGLLMFRRRFWRAVMLGARRAELLSRRVGEHAWTQYRRDL